MTVAKVTEIIASSKKGFDDAVENGVARAAKTVKGISSAWVKNQSVTVKNGKVVEYRVNLSITFILENPKPASRTKKTTKKKTAKKKTTKKKTTKKKTTKKKTTKKKTAKKKK